MSGRKPRETGFEVWIAGYLKRLRNNYNTRSEAKFIEKAIMMLNVVLGEPCCSDPENMVTLITPNDNTLTNSLRQMLLTHHYIRRIIRPSLFRVLNLLNDALYDRCCEKTFTVSYTNGITPADVTIQFFDLVTGDFLFSTTTTGGNTQSANLQAKYFGRAALIRVQMTILSSPSSPNTYALTDGTNTLVSASVTGITPSTFFEPLQPAYTIELL
jgi:hypothetical protein